MTDNLAADIQLAALECVGAPYVHMGRSRETGLDCAGLVIWVRERVGLGRFQSITYGRRPNSDQFKLEIIRAGAESVPLKQVAPGDILRFKVKLGPPVHTGVLVHHGGILKVVHAFEPSGKVTLDPMDARMWGLVSDVWRFRRPEQ